MSGRFPEPIAIRVRQKVWIQIRFDALLHNPAAGGDISQSYSIGYARSCRQIQSVDRIR
jgi:hypothetical protein